MFYLDFKISLLVATGVVGFFLNKAPDGFFSVAGKKAYLQIFVTAVAIGWILAVAMFSSFIAGLHERFSATNWWLCVSRCTFTYQFLEAARTLKLRMKMEEIQLIDLFSSACYQGGDSICCLGNVSLDRFSSSRCCCSALLSKKNHNLLVWDIL